MDWLDRFVKVHGQEEALSDTERLVLSHTKRYEWGSLGVNLVFLIIDSEGNTKSEHELIRFFLSPLDESRTEMSIYSHDWTLDCYSWLVGHINARWPVLATDDGLPFIAPQSQNAKSTLDEVTSGAVGGPINASSITFNVNGDIQIGGQQINAGRDVNIGGDNVGRDAVKVSDPKA